MTCDVIIVILKSYEVNNLILYIDDDQCNQRALLLSVDDDHVSSLYVCDMCKCYFVCLSVCLYGTYD